MNPDSVRVNASGLMASILCGPVTLALVMTIWNDRVSRLPMASDNAFVDTFLAVLGFAAFVLSVPAFYALLSLVGRLLGPARR